ncbi:MAG: hypothetical protein BGO78_07120 [Chloroflexi bacterium 44-23]|nr:MAG: hypothetical protein BGO78_07120 [Chloroflexi bacterium 44-23]
MPLRLELIAEQKILEAIQTGVFDNLSGEGKPIQWKENVFAPDEWRMAFDIFQQNGYLLPWMEKRREIEETYEQLISQCKLALARGDINARAEFFKQVDALNRKIIDYNLIVPLAQFQRPTYDARNIYNKLKELQNN